MSDEKKTKKKGEKNRTVSDVVRTVQLEEVEAKTVEVTTWIESKLKEKLKKSLREALVDGVVLCKLSNAIKPGCIAKYHRQPKLLMMKMENISFFLIACKTRFQVPSPMLFQPTDLHDDADVASMRKVLNVLIFLKHEVCGEGGSSTYKAEYDDEDEEEENNDEAEQAHDEHVSDEEHEEPPAATPSSTATAGHTTHHPTPAPSSTNSTHSTATNGSHEQHEAEWYSNNRNKSDLKVIQEDVIKVLTQTIHSELSVASKLKLVESLNHHITAFHNKVMQSSDNELHTLAHQMGLGKSEKDLPAKDREWYLEFVLKFGRVQ